MKTINAIDAIIHKFEKNDQHIIHQTQETSDDESIEHQSTPHQSTPHETSYEIQNNHLIYFNFTNYLLNNSKPSKYTKLTKSLLKLLISCIDKYGVNNIKIYLNIDNVNLSNNNCRILKKCKSLNKQLIDCDLMDLMDGKETKKLLKYKIDLLQINMNKDINNHFNYMLDNDLKDEQFKYRKISMINIEHNETNCKNIQRCLFTSQTYNEQNTILHNDDDIDSDQILSILDEYFFNKQEQNDNNINDEQPQSDNALNHFSSNDFAMPVFDRSDSSIFQTKTSFIF